MQPGGFANYPRPARGEVSFSVIGEAWQIITKNLGPFAVAALIAIVLASVPVGLGYSILFATMSTAPATDVSAMLTQQLKSMAIITPMSMVAYGLAGPAFGSIAIMTLKHLSGEKVEMSDATSGFSRFLPFAVISLIVNLVVTLGSYCCYIPGFIAGGLSLIALPAIADRGMSAFDAISYSFSTLSKHLVAAAALFFVLSLVSGLGAIACCVGIFVTMPMLYVGATLVYRDFQAPSPMSVAPGVPAPSPVADEARPQPPVDEPSVDSAPADGEPNA